MRTGRRQAVTCIGLPRVDQQRLTAEDIPSPSAYDRARNRHRTGEGWAKGAVRAILLNPRYTGHQVWSRQHKDEILLDVEDVTLGHTTKLRWNPAEQWIWSGRPAHEALISREDWDTAQEILGAGRRTRTAGTRLRTRHPYALRGRVTCGVCMRLMQGNWTNDQAYYRCRYPEQYALARHITHPRNVLLREAVILPQLDAWLATAFSPAAVRQTINAMVAHQDNPARQAQTAALEDAVADAEHRLRRYRAALDGGNAGLRS